ncbi:MAG: GTP-binding protein [Pseudomonadota bacterium]
MSETGAAHLARISNGGKRALAGALSQIEAAPDDPGIADLLDAAAAAPRGFSLGLTGPPGVGKSTLTDALVRAMRTDGKSVAVIAIDPSSMRTGGALLGDRTRLITDPTDAGVFIRSMAARDRLGGVAEITFPAMVLMRALYDLVVVETVGVGQSETEIAETTDLVAYCAQPGSGDALQFMKSGIMEVPDLIVVTKADMGPVAVRAVSDLKGALSLSSAGEVPVLSCSASTGDGIAQVLHEICTIAAELSPRFAESRRSALNSWSDSQIRMRFGTIGLRLVAEASVDKSRYGSFSDVLRDRNRLSEALTAAFQ